MMLVIFAQVEYYKDTLFCHFYPRIIDIIPFNLFINLSI